MYKINDMIHFVPAFLLLIPAGMFVSTLKSIHALKKLHYDPLDHPFRPKLTIFSLVFTSLQTCLSVAVVVFMHLASEFTNRNIHAGLLASWVYLVSFLHQASC
jgi:hypothetical protein